MARLHIQPKEQNNKESGQEVGKNLKKEVAVKQYRMSLHNIWRSRIPCQPWGYLRKLSEGLG